MGVYEKHGEEIALYQVAAGRDRGRLLFATAILSDVEHMLDSDTPLERVQEELEEAKELIVDVQKGLNA